MKKFLLLSGLTLSCLTSFCWGFFGHRKINYYAVFLLPPEMMVLYKPNIPFLEEHSVDPDKRRYIVAAEAPRHYIDMDRYGLYPFDSLPHSWNAAAERFSVDTLNAHGIVPWWIQVMLGRLTNAFREKDQARILKYSAEIGHYIADSHVPLHTSSNHNGQFTNQKGIHGFWESRIPELLADQEWDFIIGQARYVSNPLHYTWQRVLESAAAVDSVLLIEKKLSADFKPDQQYAYEDRNGTVIRQYSAMYSRTYNKRLNGMVERRMRLAIYSVACFWYTAWINAGQPNLRELGNTTFSTDDLREFEELNSAWKNNNAGEHE